MSIASATPEPSNANPPPPAPASRPFPTRTLAIATAVLAMGLPLLLVGGLDVDPRSGAFAATIVTALIASCTCAAIEIKRSEQQARSRTAGILAMILPLLGVLTLWILLAMFFSATEALNELGKGLDKYLPSPRPDNQ